MNIIRYDVKVPVTVRKHEVDIKALQELLRSHKKSSGLSNKQIGQALNRPITEVEHWFRTDKCFSIPQPELWMELKNLLGIETEAFDKQVMEFVEVDGVYDQANRIYDVEGISPTLTVASEVLILEPIIVKADLLTRNNPQRQFGFSQQTCFTLRTAVTHGVITTDYQSTYQDTWTKGESNGMKVNSFFCGAGGFDLGFIQAGFEITGAWDFDKYAVQSYNHNIGGAEQADVSKMKGEQIPKSHGWLFGFPCQDISVAGKQKGMIKGETRSGLFYEIMRLLGEVSDKPEWILAENVKAVNKFIPTIEEEYDKAGYTLVSPQLYNSKFWFVPQNRERYFLLGIRKDLSKSFLFPEQQTDFIPKLSSILEENVDEKYYIDDLKAAKIIEQAMSRVELKGIHACITPDRVDKRQNGRRAKENEDAMFTVTAQDLHGIIIDPSQEKREGKYRIYDESSPTLNARDYKDPRMVVEQPTIKLAGSLDHYGNDQMNRVYSPEGVSPTALVVSGGGREIKILEEIQSVFTDKDGVAYCCDANYAKGISPGDVGNGRKTQVVEGSLHGITANKAHGWNTGNQYSNDYTGTVTSRDYKDARMVIEEQNDIPRYRVRKLTPREYARLQGFPDSYEQIVSNSQFYKQMGNAVTVNVSHAIATAIKEQL